MLWVQFAICAALVIVVGNLLSRYADILAEKTGLGRSWAGAVLLAGATSLPELATGTSAVVVIGDVNLAAGGVLGSCLFNLLLLALLDLANGREPLFRSASLGHILSAGLGGALLALVMLSVYATQTLALPALGWVGVPSLVIIGAYVVGVRLIGSFERRRVEAALDQQAAMYQYDRISVRRAGGVFAVLCLAIVGLGLWLAAIGDQIVTSTGLGASFVGSIFLAITTSLPEVVASVAALRIGAVDLAVSNIFGSNIFNIVALAFYDVVNVRGDLWQQLNPIHGFTAVAAALMTAVAIVGLIYQATRKPRWLLSWDGSLLIVVYIGSMYTVYQAPS
jgi:cation:H+ antiporter